MDSLPYHAKTTLSNITEVTTTKPCTHSSTYNFDHGLEVFMLSEGHQNDEEANISNDKNKMVGEIHAEKANQ
jgi:hypothetical protein